MACPTCSQPMPKGGLCGSPALRGHRFCYFHHRQRSDAVLGAKAHRRRYEVTLDLPPIDTPQDIQYMLSQLMYALAADTIDYRRASAMISALRYAERLMWQPMEFLP